MTPPDTYISYRIGRLLGKNDVPMNRNELRVLGFENEKQALFWDGYAAGQKLAITPNKKD